MSIELYYRLELFQKSLRIRMIEEEIAKRYDEQEMRCPVHLSIGQEANAVAICAELTQLDYMVSTHRGHAHYLAKGGNLTSMIAEFYGKQTGCARGDGGSMHVVDNSVGFMGATSIVGGTIPIGVGLAFAAKLQKRNIVSVVCIGDAAIEEGVFHESANFASLHRLPVIFFMENNNYSCFTSRKNRQPERERGFQSVAEAHGLRYKKLSKENFYDDYLAVRNVIKLVKKCSEPVFIECDAYRFVEHCGPNSDDNLNYRPPDEIELHKRLDPIAGLERYLLASGFMDHDMLLKTKEKISEEIRTAFDQAKAHPIPDPSQLGAYLYA